MKSWRKFMVNPANARKVNWCWQKVLRPQFVYRRWMLSEDVWTQRKLTEYPRLHRKLTEGPADAQKVDESWRKHPRSYRKLTEGDGASHGRTECQRKLLRTFKSWPKVLLPHGKLKEGSSATCKVHVGLQKVPQTHEKWTEYPADALKLDGSSLKVTQVQG